MKSKEQKRMEAKERQAEYDRLSLEDRLGRLGGRRGESKKERLKIQEAIERGNDGQAQRKGKKGTGPKVARKKS